MPAETIVRIHATSVSSSVFNHPFGGNEHRFPPNECWGTRVTSMCSSVFKHSFVMLHLVIKVGDLIDFLHGLAFFVALNFISPFLLYSSFISSTFITFITKVRFELKLCLVGEYIIVLVSPSRTQFALNDDARRRRCLHQNICHNTKETATTNHDDPLPSVREDTPVDDQTQTTTTCSGV